MNTEKLSEVFGLDMKPEKAILAGNDTRCYLGVIETGFGRQIEEEVRKESF
jgi:hypothetical protein